MDPLRLVLAMAVAGTLAVERKAFLQAMIARPLVAGALLGLCLGRPTEGLAVGAGLELFYLGAVNLGAALPDNELFTTVAATACACTLASETSLPLTATLAAACLTCLPAAKLGKLTDRLSERLNARMLGIVEQEGCERRISTGLRHNLYGLWVPFLLTALAIVAGALLGDLVLPQLLALGPASLARGLGMAWVVLLIVAAAAAAHAAHTAHAFLWAALAAGASASVHVAGLLGGGR
ncbi:MAG: PTS sugar transporter subunit IIC [Myxococcales bacterium]